MLPLIRMLALLLATLAGAGQAAPLVAYQNTSTDTGMSVFYSTGPYTAIGDQLQLAGASRIASVSTQFFNGGSDASFDADLQFYTVAGLVFSPVGSSYSVLGITIAGGQSLDVSFDLLGGLDLPADVAVMLAVRNVSAGGDIGLNLFDAPTVGASDNGFFLTDDGNGIVQGSTLGGIDNLNLQMVAAAAVPEPSSGWLVLLPLLALAGTRHRGA